jgi:hypothetical protein
VRPKPLDHKANFCAEPRDGLTSCLTTWLREVGSNHRVFRLTVGCLTAWLPRNGILGKCSSDGSFQITVKLRPKNIFRTGGQSRTRTYDVVMTLDLQSSAIAALPSAHTNLELFSFWFSPSSMHTSSRDGCVEARETCCFFLAFLDPKPAPSGLGSLELSMFSVRQ